MRRLEANLFPDLGALPIAEITAPDVLAALRKIEHRGAHDLAHRVLQVASQLFPYMVRRTSFLRATGRRFSTGIPYIRVSRLMLGRGKREPNADRHRLGELAQGAG